MNESKTTIIHLPVFNSKGKIEGKEALPVEQLEPNRFRLLASPGLADGMAAGDEFELSVGEESGYALLQRAGNVCVRFYFSESVGLMTPDTLTTEAQELREAVEKIGGWLDGGLRYMLVFTLPVAIGFPTIEKLFDEAVRKNSESYWFYGNVYDPKDETTPLNWWLH